MLTVHILGEGVTSSWRTIVFIAVVVIAGFLVLGCLLGYDTFSDFGILVIRGHHTFFGFIVVMHSVFWTSHIHNLARLRNERVCIRRFSKNTGEKAPSLHSTRTSKKGQRTIYSHYS